MCIVNYAGIDYNFFPFSVEDFSPSRQPVIQCVCKPIDYASTIMSQKTAEQGADIGIINFMRGFGRIMNGLEPGAGDNAISYASDLSGTLQDEVTDAARKGSSTPVVDWARGLATPDEVAAKLASIEPLRLPPPPPMGEQRVTIGDPWSSR